MQQLSFMEMEDTAGGSAVSTGAGAACAASLSGFFFGGFPGVVTSLIFGPTCIGLSIASLTN